MNKNRNIWENIMWALAATPMVMIVGLIIITLIGAIDDAITIIQARGQWWIIVIVAFVVSLIYLLYEPSIRKNIERKKTLDALVLYFREQLRIRGVEQLTEIELEPVKKMLLEKIKLWELSDPHLWNLLYPNEQYPDTLFGIVDNFIIYLEEKQRKISNK